METIEWIKSLVEERKDDTDFIVQAQKAIDEISNIKPEGLEEIEEIKNQLTEKEELIKQMEEENEKLKKSFYETFVSGGVDVDKPNEDVDEKHEEETLGIDELLGKITKE